MKPFPLQGDDAMPNSPINNIIKGAQDRNLTHRTAAPSQVQIDTHELQLYTSGGNMFLVTKDSAGNLKKVQLT